MCPLNSRRKGTKNFLIVQIYLQFLLFFFNFGIFSEQNKKKQKNLRIAGFFSSATRTRTGVYGVRGRCPRPLDDSTFSNEIGCKSTAFF